MAELTKSKIKERRMERLRLGQAVSERYSLVSDSGIKVSMVPLTEREWDQAISEAVLPEYPDSATAMQLRDRRMSHWVLCFSIREPLNLSERVFDDPDELTEELSADDVTFLIDCYYEMVERASPTLPAMNDEEIDALKKVLQDIQWNELSGKSWYALRRFLSTISPTQLADNSFGSSLTKSLTMMNELEKSTPTASGNSTEKFAKSVESPSST